MFSQDVERDGTLIAIAHKAWRTILI